MNINILKYIIKECCREILNEESSTNSEVYYTFDIDPDRLVDLYKALNVNLQGKVAVKLHSGEPGNQNFIKPEFWKPIIDYVHGTVVECNTAYESERNTTEKHKKVMEDHGWDKYFDFDILDSDGSIELDVSHPNHLTSNLVGSKLDNYDSLLVLSHFKGHPMAGYGGALKNIGIGLASREGKKQIHGENKNEFVSTDTDCSQNIFLMNIADAASTIVDKFKGKIVFINVATNISVDCDCCAKAEDPCISDVGMFASIDPVALDTATIDIVTEKDRNEKGWHHFEERINSRNGKDILKYGEYNKTGTTNYNIINIESPVDESVDKSVLDSNFKKKDKIKLSDLRMESRQRNDEGKSLVLSWYNDKDFVATILVDTIPASDDYKWFGSFRVSKKYRGHGLGDQILDLVTSPKYKAGALSVNKDNEIAIRLYKKHGFEISRTRTSKEYYYMYLKKNKIDSNNVNESKDISTIEDGFKKKSGKSFKLIDLNTQAALKYVSDKWRNEKYASIAICKEDDKLAGYVYVNKSGNIAPLKVYENYRGYGLSEILMKEAWICKN